jgi:hypothetical protein
LRKKALADEPVIVKAATIAAELLEIASSQRRHNTTQFEPITC